MADAYCGPAPDPQSLAAAWNFDAVAIIVALAFVVAYARQPQPGQRLPLVVSVGLFLALFITPLCALTVALFSARVAHHVLLVAIVAPLLALAMPARPKLSLQWLVTIHALVLWFWHAPPIYEAAIVSGPLYWSMQLGLLGSAFLLWQRIFAAETQLGASLLALLATIVQMGMLGALLTFAREPLYEAHLTTTLPFGLTPHADQQLAGLIMWVPAALPYLFVAILLVTRRFERAQMPVRR